MFQEPAIDRQSIARSAVRRAAVADRLGGQATAVPGPAEAGVARLRQKIEQSKAAAAPRPTRARGAELPPRQSRTTRRRRRGPSGARPSSRNKRRWTRAGPRSRGGLILVTSTCGTRLSKDEKRCRSRRGRRAKPVVSAAAAARALAPAFPARLAPAARPRRRARRRSSRARPRREGHPRSA